MKITETKIKIKDLDKGFNISELVGSDENVMCYDGKLNCRPAYQRNYVYDTEKVKGKNYTKQEEVLNTIFRGYESKTKFPIGVMYWEKMPDGTYQLLDGQQRTLSVLLYRNNNGTYKGKTYSGLQKAERDWFDEYEFVVYVCEQDKEHGQTENQFEAEVLEWFEVINIAGSPLTDQELRNAVYFGEFVSAAKTTFSNPKSDIFKDKYDTEKYITINKAKMNRQEFLERVIKWRSENLNLTVDEYMSNHRNDSSDGDLRNYFFDVLKWAKNTFTEYNEAVLKGLDWGTLYNEYSASFSMDTDSINQKVRELYEDEDVIKKDGIAEYILSGCENESFLNIRQFDKSQKQRAFNLQKGICPLCEDEKKKYPERDIKIQYTLKEMEGDHIIPWSKGGKTDDDNCCMLCKNHNRQKSAAQISWLEDYMRELHKKL